MYRGLVYTNTCIVVHEENEEKERRRRNKEEKEIKKEKSRRALKFSHLIFFHLRRVSRTLGVFLK